MRLQVALSRAGFASRRKSAEIIENGLVEVNGRVVTEPGKKVDPEKDRITCHGREISFQKRIYILLNKPKGVITTASDERGRETVLDLLPRIKSRLYPVGRLDKDTSGLILLTNDGELGHKLMHPRFRVKRVYNVMIKGELTDKNKSRLEKGIYIEGKRTAPCKIHVLRKSGKKTSLKMELREGKKRQIRIMFERLDYPVAHLERVSFGPLRLGELKSGAYRHLSAREIELLKKGPVHLEAK